MPEARDDVKTKRTGVLAGLLSGRAAETRRRALAQAGALAALVLILVVVPGYISSRSGFLSRYPALEAQHKTWSTSVHAQVPCIHCHVEPRLANRALYRARMLVGFYVSLVSRAGTPVSFPSPANDACSSCHIDLRTVSPSGDLNIPHRAHVSVLKLACVKCHANLVHAPSPEGKHTPRMALCLTCHDGQQAKNACSTCHTRKNVPRSHRGKDWVVVHPKMQGEIDCEKCHGWTRDWCAECHRRKPASHGLDWRAKHRIKVARHRNCEACHEAPFCIRCHGEVPAKNLDATLKFVR